MISANTTVAVVASPTVSVVPVSSYCDGSTSLFSHWQVVGPFNFLSMAIFQWFGMEQCRYKSKYLYNAALTVGTYTIVS